jgi:hypothetical protein
MRAIEASIIAAVLTLVSVDALADRASWTFLQSVGGLTVGEPQRENGAWMLPIYADVSGLNNASTRPTTLNSGVACLETRASVEGSTVALSIFTGVAGSGRVPRCPAANLGHLAPGAYTVVYRGVREAEVSVRRIVIAP